MNRNNSRCPRFVRIDKPNFSKPNLPHHDRIPPQHIADFRRPKLDDRQAANDRCSHDLGWGLAGSLL